MDHPGVPPEHNYDGEPNNQELLSDEESYEDESNEEENPSPENENQKTVPQKKKRKRKNPNLRKNIRKVKELDAATQMLRLQEQERLHRLGLASYSVIDALNNLPIVGGKCFEPVPTSSRTVTAQKTKGVTSSQFSKSAEVICLDSDSDEGKSRSIPIKKVKVTSEFRGAIGRDEILVLSSDSEEDREEDDYETILDERVQASDYYNELGLHANDELNVAGENGKVLVNINHPNKDCDIFLPEAITQTLKPHQIGGVRFLYDNLIGSVSEFRSFEGNGCILAHAMGLGKTIQTITFIDIFMRYTPAKKVLCVVPVNTIQNWVSEFNRWLPQNPKDVLVENDKINTNPAKFKTNLKILRKKKIELAKKLSHKANGKKALNKQGKNGKSPRASDSKVVKQLLNHLVGQVDQTIQYEDIVQQEALLYSLNQKNGSVNNLIYPRIGDQYFEVSNSVACMTSQNNFSVGFVDPTAIVYDGKNSWNNFNEYNNLDEQKTMHSIGNQEPFNPIASNHFVKNIDQFHHNFEIQQSSSSGNNLENFCYTQYGYQLPTTNFNYKIQHPVIEQPVIENKEQEDAVKNVVSELVNQVSKNVENEENIPSTEGTLTNYRSFQLFMIEAQKSQSERARIIEKWDQVGGVLLIGYEMYRAIVMEMSSCTNKKKKKSKLHKEEGGDVIINLSKAICDPGPDLVVCDEGHRIRNYQSSISQALKAIKTRKRLVLTGYPLQNNLIEYWCMVDFVRPNYLGTRLNFSNMFERPIMNGQCIDSTNEDKLLMRQRAHVLYSLLQGFVQRRGHDVLKQTLPSKQEYVLMIRLSPIQKDIYKRLILLTKECYGDGLNPIKTFCLCCKIWNHPDILYNAIKSKLEGNLVDIISDQDDILLEDGKPRRKKKPPQRLTPTSSASASSTSKVVYDHVGFNPFGTESRDLVAEIDKWAGDVFKQRPYTTGCIENSGKFVVLKQIIDNCCKCGDKLLVFSQSLLTLNTIEEMLQKTKLNDATEECWRKGRDYYRLDGSTGPMEREKLINSFNSKENHQTKLFLLSTRAGCLGINLIAANRVVVFDVSWNPCHDAQAVCRIYRYGQVKPCYIYRLVSSNTMEKKIYYRQISKQGISDRVVDEMNLTENFSKSEIQTLIMEDWVDENLQYFNSSTISSYKDQILQSLMQACPKWIVKAPFKHESLLINESKHKLSGNEKRAAKEEYEKAKMSITGGQVPHRTYPLQQNFPSNTPVAPVRPFLWRPPNSLDSSSWLNMANRMPSSNSAASEIPFSSPLSETSLGAYLHGPNAPTPYTDIWNLPYSTSDSQSRSALVDSLQCIPQNNSLTNFTSPDVSARAEYPCPDLPFLLHSNVPLTRISSTPPLNRDAENYAQYLNQRSKSLSSEQLRTADIPPFTNEMELNPNDDDGQLLDFGPDASRQSEPFRSQFEGLLEGCTSNQSSDIIVVDDD